MFKLWLNFVVGCCILTAGANVLPRETRLRGEANNVIGWTPKPTSGPVAINDPFELFKRQQTNTCGYLDGNSSEPFTCPGSGYCAQNSVDSAAGCCTGILTNCYIPTYCFDYAAYQGGDCASAGPYTGCCESSAYPYCVTYLFPDRTAYRCGVRQTTFTIAYTASSAFSSTTSQSSSSKSSSSTSSSSTSSSSTSFTPSTLPPIPVPSPTTTTTPTIPPTPPPTPTPTASSSSTPIGAIVGGVVGGIAVIAITGFLIFFLMRRNRSSKQASHQVHQDPSIQPPMQQPPMQPAMHQPTQDGMKPPIQQPMQQQAAPVYYQDPRYPDNRQSMVKQYPYESVAEQNNTGPHGYQGSEIQQSPPLSPNPVYTPSSPGPPVYMPQGPTSEMSGSHVPRPGVAELGHTRGEGY